MEIDDDRSGAKIVDLAAKQARAMTRRWIWLAPLYILGDLAPAWADRRSTEKSQ
jgi:hypothetical protein